MFFFFVRHATRTNERWTKNRLLTEKKQQQRNDRDGANKHARQNMIILNKKITEYIHDDQM